ncbi:MULTISPECIES: DUF802 domain-containing protein [Lysobacter]|uniref:DUF802 domain-containing protein n=1 Tax=Lysobacter TaxID=68 RepID=UPI001F23C4C6|nr:MULTISPECIES: DUF802 domain-containing protein [Lysobacter]UJB19709.1 DUF802 domain-containing protein [Lysobacter capsici]UJQ26565.1 DUF802 domain-containing protein [Lysobacter gummosus]
MFRNLLYPAIFVVGLIAVCWVGAGYVGTNTLALSVALLIGACYCAGGLELHRYRQATATLDRALAELSAPPADLSEWLGRLHPSLRNAARLRIEGERVALPAPALTTYLVGLLVLLGMLGTLLGMMTTLRGTGLALESAADLQAIRESIAAPVAGLGFAFGTSIAGVAASAMLGLLSALSRRERAQAAQRLDVAIATTLRAYSQTHRREEAFKLLQRQAEMMPTLVDRLQEMTAAIERQNLLAHERQMARQDAFHDKTEAVFAQLAASVERSLQDSIGESARAAGAALQPIMQTTMAAIADETRSLQATVSDAVQQQMDGLSAGFATTTTRVTEIWSEALVDQRRCNEALAQDLGKTLDGFTARFDQGAAGLLDTVSARFDATADNAVEAWNGALSRQLSAHQDMAARNQQAQLAAAKAWNEALSQQLGANEAMAARNEQAQLAAAKAWSEALSQQLDANEAMAARNQQALAAAAATFESHAASLVRASEQSHAQLQTTLESRDEQRLAAWTGVFDSMAASLGERWEHSGEHAAQRQREICDTLARTAQEITAQSQSQAQDTIAEISRLVDAASQAPKAAAEVVAELRQKLSDSMVRDTAMLDERNRLLATLETLLDAVNHASTEQRVAVDALVVTSADLLDRVGTRFTDHIEAETGKLGATAAQISVGAVEVASLSDAFAAAVQQFGESNELLTARLQGVETALDKSLARSDEQLAYYVAQAKEVIDLSMLAQKQIIQDIQQLAQQPAAAGAQAA